MDLVREIDSFLLPHYTLLLLFVQFSIFQNMFSCAVKHFLCTTTSLVPVQKHADGCCILRTRPTQLMRSGVSDALDTGAMQHLWASFELPAGDLAGAVTAECTVMYAIDTQQRCKGKRTDNVLRFGVHLTRIPLTTKCNQRKETITRINPILQSAAIDAELSRSQLKGH